MFNLKMSVLTRTTIFSPTTPPPYLALRHPPHSSGIWTKFPAGSLRCGIMSYGAPLRVCPSEVSARPAPYCTKKTCLITPSFFLPVGPSVPSNMLVFSDEEDNEDDEEEAGPEVRENEELVEDEDHDEIIEPPEETSRPTTSRKRLQRAPTSARVRRTPAAQASDAEVMPPPATAPRNVRRTPAQGGSTAPRSNTRRASVKRR